MPANAQTAEQILKSTAAKYRGTGGAIAVLQNGKLLAQHVWGYADIEKRIQMTTETLMPICSISKQMLCAVVTELERNPTPEIVAKGNFMQQLSERLHQVLQPEITRDTGLTVDHLMNNASGIRDYWAMSMLWGARPDGVFRVVEDGPKALERTRSLHFGPGTEFSYCNLNFHIVARLVESVSGQSLGELLSERVFTAAGMKTAVLHPDTATIPPPYIGYVGDEQHGYMRARNFIEWKGDAGNLASLADMIAYEQYIDASNADPNSWYSLNSKPPTYTDGTPASYGHGLVFGDTEGVAHVSHQGMLDGARLCRLYAPSERLSVLVMFNHEGDAGEAAEHILKKVLQIPEPKISNIDPVREWNGVFLDPELLLSIVVKQDGPGEISITYAGSPEKVRLIDGHHASSPDMVATVDGDQLSIHRIKDHRQIQAQRIGQHNTGFNAAALVGDYNCAEADSFFRCEGESVLYGAFTGFLGQGPPHLMKCLGDNVWALSCPRGMDAPAPGDWTIVFHGDESGNVLGFTIGCWLARKLRFVKTTGNA